MSAPKRGDFYWVNLDPTVGSEINKKRPAVIVSNNVGNEFSSRVIVAPITSKVSKIFPFEVEVELKGKKGKILLDQIRAIDKIRLQEKIAPGNEELLEKINTALKIVLSLE